VVIKSKTYLIAGGSKISKKGKKLKTKRGGGLQEVMVKWGKTSEENGILLLYERIHPGEL